jgi:hypothetical protein
LINLSDCNILKMADCQEKLVFIKEILKCVIEEERFVINESRCINLDETGIVRFGIRIISVNKNKDVNIIKRECKLLTFSFNYINVFTASFRVVKNIDVFDKNPYVMISIFCNKSEIDEIKKYTDNVELYCIFPILIFNLSRSDSEDEFFFNILEQLYPVCIKPAKK